MPRRLPSLDALRVFEAAARYLSFTRAADELHVTQAAVSQRIRSLEESLGVPLFKRLNRALLLSDDGQALYPPVRDALDQMAGAVEGLSAGDASGVPTVTTMDSFAATWLVPRLKRFRERHPEIDVRIWTSDKVFDLTREDVDMAVRYGRGDWPGLEVVRLMTEEVFPVCSPDLVKRGPPLEKPADLARHTLIHDSLHEDWRMWLLAAGAPKVDATRGPGYYLSNLVVQAAVAGEGVALGRSVLVADELASGRLVKPFDVSLPVEFAYYVVSPEATKGRPKIKAFREWLLQEAGSLGGTTGKEHQSGEGPEPKVQLRNSSRPA